jgi:small subunit ribosomal protein S9
VTEEITETAVVDGNAEAAAGSESGAADAVAEVVETVVAEPRPQIKVGVPAGATGRRKEAIARVRLIPGSGKWTINGRTLEDYFPNKVHQQIVREPLTTLEVQNEYDVLVRVQGGGVSGQAGAVRLGVARSLLETDDAARPPLKRAGFLTRDARVKERKKYGLKKARKAPQYSKR